MHLSILSTLFRSSELTCIPFSRPRKSGKFLFSGLGCCCEEKADETVEIH